MSGPNLHGLFLKNVFFVLIVPATVGIYAPLFVARHSTAAKGTPLVLAACVLALGALIVLWCVYDFASYGRGTPFPLDAPKKLVVRGLYRYVRNPMYVGVLLLIAGWTILFRGWRLVLYGVITAAFFYAFVVLYEERKLGELFGSEYADYCARVGRWVPRPRRKGRSRAALDGGTQGS